MITKIQITGYKSIKDLTLDLEPIRLADNSHIFVHTQMTKILSYNIKRIIANYLILAKHNWKKWNLPTKLTVVGAYIAIFLFAIFLVNQLYYFTSREGKIKRILVKNDWVIGDIMDLYKFAGALNDNDDNNSYNRGLLDGEVNETTILIVNTLLASGIITFDFKKNNTIIINNQLDKEGKNKFDYRIFRENEKMCISLSDNRKSSFAFDDDFEIRYIDDKKCVLYLLGGEDAIYIMKDEEFIRGIEIEIRSVN